MWLSMLGLNSRHFQVDDRLMCYHRFSIIFSLCYLLSKWCQTFSSIYYKRTDATHISATMHQSSNLRFILFRDNSRVLFYCPCPFSTNITLEIFPEICKSPLSSEILQHYKYIKFIIIGYIVNHQIVVQISEKIILRSNFYLLPKKRRIRDNKRTTLF